MSGPLEMQLRGQLAGLARDPKRRVVGSLPERPVRWSPEKVLDIEGNGLTGSAAWEIIAERLEDTCQIMGKVRLNRPAGLIAYVLKFKMCYSPCTIIYAKVELIFVSDGKKVCGRSFHEDDPR